jgi:hypothetical protein
VLYPDYAFQGIWFRRNLFVDIGRILWEADHGPLYFGANIFVNTRLGLNARGAGTSHYYHNMFFRSDLVTRSRGRTVLIYDPAALTASALNSANEYLTAFANNKKRNNIIINPQVTVGFGGDANVGNVSDNNVYYQCSKPSGEGANSKATANFANFTYSVDRSNGFRTTISFTVDDAPGAVNCPYISDGLIGGTPLPPTSTLVTHRSSNVTDRTGGSPDLTWDYFKNSYPTGGGAKAGPFVNLQLNQRTTNLVVWPK